jgi:hypothetical protein
VEPATTQHEHGYLSTRTRFSGPYTCTAADVKLDPSSATLPALLPQRSLVTAQRVVNAKYHATGDNLEYGCFDGEVLVVRYLLVLRRLHNVYSQA